MVVAQTIERVAKASLTAAVAGTGVLAFGPFQALEARICPWDKAEHAAAFYVLTVLAFTAFPRRRRNDMALALVLLGALVEAIQGVVGRDADWRDALADAAGVLAVHVPAHLEALRQRMREPSGSRRRSRRRVRRSGAPATAAPLAGAA